MLSIYRQSAYPVRVIFLHQGRNIAGGSRYGRYSYYTYYAYLNPYRCRLL